MKKKILKIKTGDFTSLGYSAFSDKFVEIVQAVLANSPVFMTLPIPEPDLQDAASSIVTLTNKAKKGSDIDKDNRDIQKALCISYLILLSNYVLQVASTKETLEEEVAVVTLSKFTLVKMDNEPVPPLPQIQGVKGKWTGHDNEALVEWDRIQNGVILYKVYKTFTDPASPSTVWEFVGETTRKKKVISDLAPQLTPVWVRVVAVGKDGDASIPSDPALVAVEF